LNSEKKNFFLADSIKQAENYYEQQTAKILTQFQNFEEWRQTTVNKSLMEYLSIKNYENEALSTQW